MIPALNPAPVVCFLERTPVLFFSLLECHMLVSPFELCSLQQNVRQLLGAETVCPGDAYIYSIKPTGL